MTSETGPTWWETAICIVIIVMLTGGVIGPIFAPTQEETPILRLVWLPAFAAILGLVAFRINRMWRVWPAAILVGLTVLLCLASKYWSIDPTVTQRRTILLALTSLFALYLGAVYRDQELPRLLMLSTFVMAVGSLIMVFAFPSIGVHHDVNAGLWRGLWYEKNQMGAVMVIGATASAACILSAEPKWKLAVVTFGLSSILVLATQSKTSLLCLMLALALIGGCWVMRRGGPAFTVFAIWLAVVLSALGIWMWETHSVAILEALGKDPSLTGRTDIWAALMRQVAERPMTGYGYAAFWGRMGESPPADWVRRETQWLVPSAHNGWIDLLVQLGWTGAVVVGTLMALAFLMAVLRIGGSGEAEGWWSLGFMGAFFVLSLSESILLTPQNLPWVLFIALLTRSLSAAPQTIPVSRPVARQPRRRIVPQSAHGRVQRPLPVR